MDREISKYSDLERSNMIQLPTVGQGANFKASAAATATARMKEIARAVSNLDVDKDLSIQPMLRNNGFLGLLSAKYRDNPIKMLVAGVLGRALPYMQHTKAFSRKPEEVLEGMGSKELVKYTKVTRLDSISAKRKGYMVDIPVMKIYAGNDVGGLNTWVEQLRFKVFGKAARELTNGISFTGMGPYESALPTSKEAFIANMGLIGASKGFVTPLAESLQEISYKAAMGSKVVVLRFFMTDREAQHLTNSPWLEVRSQDIHTLVCEWQHSKYGYSSPAPQVLFPLSRISSSLPKNMTGMSRVNEDGLTIMSNGSVLWLPKEVDNTLQYEAFLSKTGDRGGGVFAVKDLDNPQGDTELEINVTEQQEGLARTINMPLLLDWVNLKFVYSNAEGRSIVVALDRNVVCNVSHINQLLKANLVAKTNAGLMNNMQVVLGAIEPAYSFGFTTEERNAIVNDDPEMGQRLIERLTSLRTDTESYVEAIHSYLTAKGKSADLGKYRPDDYRFADLNEIMLLRPYYRMIQRFNRVVGTNLDIAYARYSVLTVLSLIGLAKALDKAIPNAANIELEDNARRAPYINQGEAENYQVAPVPYVTSRFQLMPHQVKVENILREGADKAFLDVKAGGGKSPLIIKNILDTLKAGKVKRPIILCPSHLISNYMKEFSFFTEGRVNCIAISTYQYKLLGEKTITDLILKAPPNTVVLVDFNFLANRVVTVSYGVTATRVYKNVEFLRQFEFDGAWVDETQYVRNSSATRTRAAQRFLSEINFVRLATGTMVHDSLTDIASQASLLDPSIFGDAEAFAAQYGEDYSGSKVSKWKQGAAKSIMARLKQYCVVATAARKEWAAILPPVTESFSVVELNDAQKEVYQSILRETQDLIQQDATKNAKFKGLLEAAESGDDTVSEVLADLLKPYLQRLESFVTAPGRDKLGNEMLEGDDRISPKVVKIGNIIDEHLRQNIIGKILVFTNYSDSAEEIYNYLESRPSTQGRAMHYKASNKEEDGAKFEKNDKIRILVGIEYSLNTGLNLQFASRLIRMETVWTPGELEQGNSRINRPELKKKDPRTDVYYNWVVANKTIDTLKITRLITKSIERAKFEEAQSGIYDIVESKTLQKMSLENIFLMNDATDTLLEYFEAHRQMKMIEHQDFADYRARNEGKLEFKPVVRSENLPGSKLMPFIPYAPGMSLYGEAELGLVRFDEYANKTETENDEDSGDDEADDSGSTNAVEDAEYIGLGVHTMLGDGTIVSLAKKRIMVLLESGMRIRVRKSSAFVITRGGTNTRDIRAQLLKMTGDIPIDTPIQVDAAVGVTTKKAQREKEAKDEAEREVPTALDITLQITIVNDFLGITLDNADSNAAAARALMNFGFHSVPMYVFTKVKSAQMLFALFQKWKDKGFRMKRSNSAAFANIYTSWKAAGKKGLDLFGLANKMNLRNFYLLNKKASNDPTMIKPYPLVQDDQLYLALPVANQLGTKKAIRIVVPGTQWLQAGGDSELICFVLDKQHAVNKLKDIKNAGINITNLKQLAEELKTMRMVKRKAVKKVEEDDDE